MAMACGCGAGRLDEGGGLPSIIGFVRMSKSVGQSGCQVRDSVGCAGPRVDFWRPFV